MSGGQQVERLCLVENRVRDGCQRVSIVFSAEYITKQILAFGVDVIFSYYRMHWLVKYDVRHETYDVRS